MRKTLRAVGIVAALAFLLAPAVVGIVAEHRLRGLLDDAAVAGSAGPQLSSYDRGWFGARSTLVYPLAGSLPTRLGLLPDGDPGVPAELLVDSEIRHGPVAGMSASGLSVATAVSTMRLRRGTATVDLPGQVHSRLDAGGRLEIRYIAGPEDWRVSPETTVRWTSADVRSVFPGAGRFQTQGVLNGLSVGSQSTSLALDTLVIEGNFHRTRHDFWAGQARVSTPLLLAARDQASFSARDVELVSDQRVAGDVTNYRLTMAAASIGGKDWNGMDAQLKLRVDGIDAAAYASVARNPLQHVDLTTLTSLQNLLVPGASIMLETLNLPTAHGAVLADFDITLPRDDPQTGTPAIAYLLTMEGQGRLQVPRQLAFALSRRDERFRDTLNRLLRMRMLKPVAGNYALEAAYGDGLLTVNGFPVPLPFVAH